MENTVMKIKTPEEIIRGLKMRYASSEENVYFMDKIFVAASVVKWIFLNSSKNEEILGYLAQVERYMNGEIDLHWEDNTIKVSKPKKGKS